MLTLTRQLYTPQEVAKLLRVSHMTVYRMIESGRLFPVTPKPYRISQEALKAFLKIV